MKRHAYTHAADGEWFRLKDARVMCCDCGLVHELSEKIVRLPDGQDEVYVSFKRLPQATAAARKRGGLKTRAGGTRHTAE